MKQLERINYIYLYNYFTIQIEGLTNLKEIPYMNDMAWYDIKEIPNSVTKLNIVTKRFSTKRIDFDFQSHPNVKSIEITYWLNADLYLFTFT